MNYYPFHLGDYAVHTRHLTLMEDLAYRRLLDLYYTHERPIPAETQSVCRLLGMRDHETEVVSVLAEFFRQNEAGEWVHDRCEAEIAKFKAAAERARTNGKAGGRPRGSKKEPTGNPLGSQSEPSGNPEESKSKAPITITITKTKEIEPTALVGCADAKPLPTCPHGEIVDLYHDVLPSLPRAKLMSDKRRKALTSFWRWVLTSKKSDGARRASTSDQALTWIRGYFERASENDFLMGRTGRGAEHAAWQCDLDFLLTERGMKHVIERTREAA